MVKAPLVNAGDVGFIPESGRFPGVGNGNPLQYSCLENSMDRGAWRATVHGVAKSLSLSLTYTHTHTHKSFLQPHRGGFVEMSDLTHSRS